MSAAPRDVEARLLRATMYRRSGRLNEATEELARTERWNTAPDGGAKSPSRPTDRRGEFKTTTTRRRPKAPQNEHPLTKSRNPLPRLPCRKPPDGTHIEPSNGFRVTKVGQIVSYSRSEGDNVMYERFTDRARKVMQLANRRPNASITNTSGPSTSCWGWSRKVSGVAANVLKNLDVDLRKIRLEVEKIVQSGSRHGHHGQAAADAPGQEGDRICDGRSPKPEPQLRGHRAHSAGTVARAGRRCRPGVDEPGS